MKKILALILAAALSLSLVACGGGGGTTCTVTNNDGEEETISAHDLKDVVKSNTIKWDNLYRDAYVVVTGKIEKIHGNIKVNGYQCEAAVEIEDGWFVELKTQEELASFDVGDTVEITGNITDADGIHIYVFLGNGYDTTIKGIDD